MVSTDRLDKSLVLLKDYIERNSYRGYDPYDALKSPLFKIPILNNSKLIRFGIQQLVKRLPFNIRSLLFINKGYNPVTIGLCLQAYSYLYDSTNLSKKQIYLDKINFLVTELEKLIPEGFSGSCWGYDFDWEARNAKIPAYMPTVVATGIITNALYVAYKITDNEACAKHVASAADFVINDLNKTTLKDSICFSYSPFDFQQVLNASVKGVRILIQANSISPNKDFLEISRKATNFIMRKQLSDGAWPYSMAKFGSWVDNYHTGYILDCLDEYRILTNDSSFDKAIKKGYVYYRKNFINLDGAPKFYNNNTYPIDCTAASQTILTTLRFGDFNLANKVANFTIDLMQNHDGSFKFRKFKRYAIKTSFMRWSNAWMFLALSRIKYEKQRKKNLLINK